MCIPGQSQCAALKAFCRRIFACWTFSRDDNSFSLPWLTPSPSLAPSAASLILISLAFRASLRAATFSSRTCCLDCTLVDSSLIALYAARALSWSLARWASIHVWALVQDGFVSRRMEVIAVPEREAFWASRGRSSGRVSSCMVGYVVSFIYCAGVIWLTLKSWKGDWRVLQRSFST